MQEHDSVTFDVVRRREEAGGSAAAETAPFVIEESLGYLVNKLARAFAQALGLRLAQHQVTVAQWAVLMFLWAEDGPTQRTLSRHVAIEEATMARTIDRMERDGLVRRVRNSGDRRQLNIFLTPRAIGLRDALVPLAMDVNASATATLSAAERDLAESLMRRMVSALASSPLPHDKESS